MGWKDMGVGHLSIKTKEGANKDTKESKPTVVVRNDIGSLLLFSFNF
jgi:nuclear pore complex protein Nup50